MLETERSSDEALRQPTFVRLYRGAFEIDNPDRCLKAAYIILLAGRLGLRTGEIQHVREAWIDWQRGEIAIPRHDPCGCMNCWIAAKQKAADDDDSVRDDIVEVIDKEENIDSTDELEDHVDILLENLSADDDNIENNNKNDNRNENRDPLEILYQERWQPKYERSARRVPFGYSRRLTAVIMLFFENNDCLEITQPTMNKLVKEAAENAKGVDPENITLRGLRATAATNYTTCVRNPKVIQDVMGWTRIETGARYIRRAGGFTTDILYNAFDKSDIAPIMFPGEPEEQYPLIGNPIPYQKEPWDPILYSPSERMNRAEEITGTPKRLIHPRSKNSPTDIPYDPTNHEILTHEDYSSDIIERGDGYLMFERPTLADFHDEHKRYQIDELEPDQNIRKYKSIEGWKMEADLEDITQADLNYTMYSLEGEVDPKSFDPGPSFSERLESSNHPIIKAAVDTIGSDHIAATIEKSKANAALSLLVFSIVTLPSVMFFEEIFIGLLFITFLVLLAPAVAIITIIRGIWPTIKNMYKMV